MGIGTDGLSQAAAAGAAAATTTLLLYPLDVVKTRLNTGTDEKGVKYDGVLDVLQRQWRRRGLRGFYSGIQVRASLIARETRAARGREGCGDAGGRALTQLRDAGGQVKLVQDVVRSVSFFYVFAVLKGMYKKRFGAIGVRDNLLLGYLSATLNLLFTMPVEVCNTRQMTGFSEGGILSIGCDLVCASRGKLKHKT
jgi:hypothetical protein